MTSSAAPRTPRRDHTRDRLLDAAAAVFAAHGYHGASVTDVAAAAGLTKGAVYSNFRSKEELFLELLDRNVDEVVALIDGLLTDRRTQRAEQLQGRLANAALFDRSWTLLELEFVLYVARNPHLARRLAERRDRTRTAIAQVVARHLAERGTADVAVAAERVARLLIAGADGLTTAALTEPDLPVTALLAALFDALERAEPSGPEPQQPAPPAAGNA